MTYSGGRCLVAHPERLWLRAILVELATFGQHSSAGGYAKAAASPQVAKRMIQRVSERNDDRLSMGYEESDDP